MEKGVTVVMGAGPGLGSALAHRFARGGQEVAVMARDGSRLESLCRGIEDEGGKAEAVEVDVTNPEAVSTAFDTVRKRLGEVSALIYNAGAFRVEGLMETTPEDFLKSWQVNCFGAFLAIRQVIPSMMERGGGSILLTSATAALRGSARFACLAVGKFGLRALAQSTAREFGPKGVHVAHFIIDGLIDTDRVRGMFPSAETKLHPVAIAETYWQVHKQPRSAWTLEMDLRPAAESF